MIAPDELLVVAQLHPACTVLGPGTRFAIWVQGCPLHCRECVSPQWIPQSGGRPVHVEELAETILATGVTGVTFSGGEPFAQAAALARLVGRLRARRDLSVLSYTGFVVEHLRAHGTPAQRGLLGQLDILIDGPYLVGRHADLRWRGSANQRIHYLTARHEPVDADRDADRGVGLQLEVGGAGQVRWLGVPAQPGFRARFEEQLQATPLSLATEATR